MSLLTSIAFSLLWIPYMWGGNIPYTGLDCSGMVLIPLKKIDLIPEKTDLSAQGIYDHLINLKFSSCAPQEDCILFFGKSVQRITHIAIAINKTRMIEARGGGRTTNSIKGALRKNAQVDLTKIDRRKDLVASIKVEY
ncbi:C40 family peptidase [Candidatus Pacearchaeota archaeon]|nr:C40 family peptidase [Candidatus Pacearchaeota archaeon]